MNIATYQAIFQLTSNDEAVYKSMIGQIKNLQNALNNAVSIEVVCHGRSSSFCISGQNPFQEAIEQLMATGVQIKVCANMLQANNLSAQQLITGIQTVPAGIAELVIRQQQGWSYIKAGF
jgi:intracellular sulfur oxidation DsrE/DsrF family protein